MTGLNRNVEDNRIKKIEEYSFTFEFVKDFDIPEEVKLETMCEFIDQVRMTDWWSYYGCDQFNQWAEQMVDCLNGGDESED